MPDDERLRAHVHDLLVAGADVAAFVADWDRAIAHRIVDVVLADYAVELNRALSSGSEILYGQSATLFMSQVGELWRLKLSL